MKKLLFSLTLVFITTAYSYAQKGGTPTTQTGSGNSGRSNGDQCCPDAVYIDRGDGTSKKLRLSIFPNEKVMGPIEVFAYNTKGVNLDLRKAIKFSKDDKSLEINYKYCAVGMPDTIDQPEKFLKDIILEFRVSGGKKNFVTLSKLNSWPPDISKPRTSLLNK